MPGQKGCAANGQVGPEAIRRPPTLDWRAMQPRFRPQFPGIGGATERLERVGKLLNSYIVESAEIRKADYSWW
jgi:hypothetical protein